MITVTWNTVQVMYGPSTCQKTLAYCMERPLWTTMLWLH